ncbi:M20/M25/M40 family metallo-hydrolase [Sulfurospirillum deleyianum]|uniref:Xaa-His dipeptidase n=1 Tax=Sulfurospirillum deleyianum (strain ATCC 51133 / DSM 6946 / 5175) TaxID=525898 RepID=D1B2P3_SULD5|nr:M20/M25/M40 family metallo-hydrolase [Sulfurospirillum deleyianum]ACZ12363.1 Xaa-His dipeptidase [Sulfurospirillum deleyianum DSM 6946]
MERILEHFRAITAIPRCSYHTQEMREFIRRFAIGCGFVVEEDAIGNLLCHKGEPKLCLQAHYDMVCIGEVERIEIVEDKGVLKAKNSTLGADNGMGMAIMFWTMERHAHLECLFTVDEEVGLIGAMHLALPLKASKLLNLDAEEAGEIYIGCAGGVDVIATLPLTFEPLKSTDTLYEIRAFDFQGGHSGVDIDKKIPSAIKALGYELLGQEGLRIVALGGGERRNAIPRSAWAVVATEKSLHVKDKRLGIQPLLTSEYTHSIVESKAIIKALGAFAQGVREWDRNLDIPSMSINLGTLTYEQNALRIACAARAMDDENLAILANETDAFFHALGFEVKQEGWHGAWKPEVSIFARDVQESMQLFFPHAPFKAIHAGLECGELIASQHKKIEAVSIGPTIRYPHSLNEECDIASVYHTASVVEAIIMKQ